jgi:hypothetical protein
MPNKSTQVADFYIGRGETAQYLGSIWGANVDPESLKAITRFQSATDVLYDEIDFRRDVTSLILDGTTFEKAATGKTWPHHYATSGTSDWAYCYDKATVHVYEEGRLVLSLLCNGARKEADFPWHGGVEPTIE